MERRSFLLTLVSCLVIPAFGLREQWNAPAVSMLHDGTRWRKVPELYIDPRCLEDIRNWGVDQIDEVTREEIYASYNH